MIDLAAFVTEYRHFEFDLLAARCVFEADACRRLGHESVRPALDRENIPVSERAGAAVVNEV